MKRILTIVTLITVIVVTITTGIKVIESKEMDIVNKDAEIAYLNSKLNQLPKLNKAVDIITKRSPAVGGLIVALQGEIEKGNDVTKLIEDLPETDLAILMKEKVLKHGLTKYAWRSEFGYPIVKPDSTYVSSEYGLGYITVPLNGKMKRIIRIHNGIDIVSKQDSRVLSVQNGIVSYIKYNDKIYGNYIMIKHKIGNEWYMSGYAHLSEIKVKYNQKVSKGELIGVIGDSGSSFGIHLHYTLSKYEYKRKKYLTINSVYSTTYGVPVESNARYKGMNYSYN